MPDVPEGLEAVTLTNTSVTLIWPGSALVHPTPVWYNIYYYTLTPEGTGQSKTITPPEGARTQPPDDSTLYTTSGAIVPPYTVSNVRPFTTYVFQVEAENALGSRGLTETVTVKTMQGRKRHFQCYDRLSCILEV